MFFKWKYVRINDYSFKYVCVVSCLKICFYCLTSSAMSNLNSADFTTRNQSSGILILKTKILLQFQNKMNSEIIGFQLMYFRFALELSDIDLWNIDLLDTRLDLLDTHIPCRYFVSIHNVFKASSIYVFKTSSRHVFKTSSRHVFKTSWRPLQRHNFWSFKTSWRRLQEVLQNVFKRSARRVLQTFWRRVQYQQIFAGMALFTKKTQKLVDFDKLLIAHL